MKLTRRLGSKKGQGTTEYMMIVAVIVIGIVAAASTMITPLKAAFGKLSENLSGWIEKDQNMTLSE